MRGEFLVVALLAAGCAPEGDFAVDNLALIHVGPSPGAVGIGIDTDIRVTFSDVLRAESVNQGSICVKPSIAADPETCTGDVVPAQASYDPVDLAIVVTPLLLLTTSTEYAIVITGDIRAENGTLPAPVRTLFTTESP